MQEKLVQRIALVDGADTATGFAIVNELLQNGSTVIAVSAKPIANISSGKGKLHLVVVPDSEKDPVSTALKQVDASLSQNIDIFISRMPTEILDPKLSQWEKDFALTYQVADRTAYATYHVSKIMLNHNRPSNIIILNGLLGENADPEKPYFSALQRFITSFRESSDAGFRMTAENKSKAPAKSNIRTSELRLSNAIDVETITSEILHNLRQSENAVKSVTEIRAAGEVVQGLSIEKRENAYAEHEQEKFRSIANDLNNKIVVVTGASEGIGKDFTRAFIEEGARVIAVGRNTTKLAGLKQLYGDKVHIVNLEISDKKAVEKAFSSLPAEWENIDILLNNAGSASEFVPLAETDPKNIEPCIDSNIRGILNCTNAILPGMVKRNHGDIVYTTSTSGIWPYPRGEVYCATKAASRIIAWSFGAQCRENDIRFMDIGPGVTETGFAANRFRDMPEDEKQRMIDATYKGKDSLIAKNCTDVLISKLKLPRNVVTTIAIYHPKNQAILPLKEAV